MFQKGNKLGKKFVKGHKINIGRKRSEMTKQKIKGKRNGRWKGGVSFNYREGYRKQAKDWARIVFRRDGYRCLICGKIGGKLNAHHIKYWSKYPKFRFNLDNGITLCEECHIREHKVKGRK